VTEQMRLPPAPKKYRVRATVSVEVTSTQGLRGAIDYVHDEVDAALSPDYEYREDERTRVTDLEIVAVEAERAGWMSGSPGPTSEQIG
jgi:hypothetical protein